LVAGAEQSVHEFYGSMVNVMPELRLTCVEQDHYEVEYTNANGQLKNMSWKGMDFHAMCKKHLEVIVAAH
jgi:hypothetical protein